MKLFIPSALKKHLKSLFFFIKIAILAILIRTFLISFYIIPSGSMESTLLVGDYIIVNKTIYGARTPSTFLNLPNFRIWGLRNVKRGDVIVFNTPQSEGKSKIENKTRLVKRCVGIAGDTFSIQQGKIYINHQEIEDPPRVQYAYTVKTSDEKSLFQYVQKENITQANEEETIVLATPQLANYLSQQPWIKHIERKLDTTRRANISRFPWNSIFSWNSDYLGSIVIPKRGMTVITSPKNLIIYGYLIKILEKNKQVEIKDEKLTINGKIQSHYTFKQDYYFMVGDNRAASHDSRAWGFVPRDHLIGKVSWIFFSFDASREGFFNSFRGDRFFYSID